MNGQETARVLALGFFDGVHRGHQALLCRAAELGRKLGLTSAGCTFVVPPAAVIAGRAVPLLSTPDDRARLMTGLCGVDEVITIPFDRAMMDTPWDVFVRDYLVGKLRARHLVAGRDYRFGAGGRGDARRLQELCGELGIGCDILEPVTLDGAQASSTRIRDLVARGEVEEAARYLGHPHVLSGRVAHGKALGRTLGFPTVNVEPDPGVLVPAYGVYAARAVLEDGTGYMACVNIGVRPTVDRAGAMTVEGFLLDFAGDLYGQRLWLELGRRLREERRFGSLEALREAVMANARETRAYFADQTQGGGLSLHVPAYEELGYRQKLMADPATMSYNRGYDLDFPGYDRETGCMAFPREDWRDWYDWFIGAEPRRFYAYVVREKDGVPLGEVNLHRNGDDPWYEMGIVMEAGYRGHGYGLTALRLLLRHAFLHLGARAVRNCFEADRAGALKLHLAAGFRELSRENGLVTVEVRREDYLSRETAIA